MKKRKSIPLHKTITEDEYRKLVSQIDAKYRPQNGEECIYNERGEIVVWWEYARKALLKELGNPTCDEVFEMTKRHEDEWDRKLNEYMDRFE